MIIFSTPGGSSSPCVSFLRFSSKARSNWWRFCSSDSLACSSTTACCSSARRMSNHCQRSRSAR
ncbi:Uncharacterised protein [Bordetella pertussis]|nr:Uncharacterised protein [Bordetella pertussis]